MEKLESHTDKKSIGSEKRDVTPLELDHFYPNQRRWHLTLETATVREWSIEELKTSATIIPTSLQKHDASNRDFTVFTCLPALIR